MAKKPIFTATHPRSCSTAFERVFFTCNDTLKCIHEPFSSVYYYGPERLNNRFEDDELARIKSGHSNATFGTVFETIERSAAEGKRVFIKDMAQYFIPPNGKPASIAPSLVQYKRGVGTGTALDQDEGLTSTTPSSVNSNSNHSLHGSEQFPYPTPPESGNPTIVPEALLSRFNFAFLIRHPRSSIPSYYRCTLEPLRSMTGWMYFDPSEAGYLELRQLFDFLRERGLVGPNIAGSSNDSARNGANGATNHDGVDICIIDADDMLDDPYGIISAYCKNMGLSYSESMLKWSEEDQKRVEGQFKDWKGFHEDAIHSTELKPRTHRLGQKSDQQQFQEWVEKYGEEAAKMIKKTVDDNVEHYEYLKQFAIKV